MNIDTTTKQHGAASALALVLAIYEKPTLPEDKDRQGIARRDDLLRSYLRAFPLASPGAQCGFLFVLGDFIASAAAGAVPSEPAEFYSERAYTFGIAPTPREREAHAQAWLERGAVSARSVQDGRGAALAFLQEAFKPKPAGAHDKTVPSEAFDSALDEYLSAYATASPEARRGFRSILRDLLEHGYRGTNIDLVTFYTGREYHSGKRGPGRRDLPRFAKLWRRATAFGVTAAPTSQPKRRVSLAAPDARQEAQA
jgi:hypothetical protein